MHHKLSTLLPRDAVASLVEMALVAPETGCFVEFGVYRGGSAWYLYQIADGRQLHLFDTFTGMPFADEGDSHAAGEFADTDQATIQAALPNAILHPGEFPKSLAPSTDLPLIAFAHIDCDQYRSIKAAIENFVPLLTKGGIMLFDDYDCLDSARRAVDESQIGIRFNRWGKAYFQK